MLLSSCGKSFFNSENSADSANADSAKTEGQTGNESETKSFPGERAKILEVVNRWNKSLNLRDENISMSVFADEVFFYTKTLSAAECTRARINAAMSDPTWEQSIISDISLETNDDGSVMATFTKQSSGKKGKHTYPAYLILKKYGEDWKIIHESDKLTDRNVTKKRARIPSDAIRGDFDGDGKIDRVWIEGKYDSEGYALGPMRLRSDNEALNNLAWDDATRGVTLVNLGDLNGTNRDFLGAIPLYDSTWTVFRTYAFKEGKWKSVVPEFVIWMGNEDINRVWKSSRKGYVVISTNDMADTDNCFDNTTREVRLNY